MKLGTVAAGTNVLNLDYLPEKLLFVDSVTGVQVADQVTALSIVNKGRQMGNLTQTRVSAFARLGAFIAGAAQLLSEWLTIGDGRNNGSSTITITHGNANPVDVYGVSNSFATQIVNYVETSINAFANQSFDDFNALVLSTPANIDRVNLTFADGFNDDFSVPELKALIGSAQNTNASGLLNGNLVVPNFLFGSNPIRAAIVYVNGSGSCVVGVQRFVSSI